MSREDIFVTGHIFNADLTKVQFVFDANQFDSKNLIENGEIITSYDKNTDELYFLRVNNIFFGQNSDWTKEIARGYNHQEKTSDLSNEHTSPGDVYNLTRDDQLYHIADCEILGVSKNGSFTSARRLPSYFSKVKKLSDTDLKTHLSDFVGDLQFANVRSGSNSLNVSGGIFKDILPKHIGVFAKTGGGKSNTIKTLLGSIFDTNGEAAALILEPHGEYSNELIKHPMAEDRLFVYNQDGRKGQSKIRISFSRVSVESVLSIGKQMRWSEPQERLMFEASGILKNKWFETLVTLPIEEASLNDGALVGLSGSDDGDVMDFDADFSVNTTTTISQIFPSTNIETIRATQSKLRRIANSTFLTKHDNQDDLDNVFQKLDNGVSVLLDMAKLNKLEELFLSSIMAGEALRRRKNAFLKEDDGSSFDRKYSPIVIVMEEAQRVLGRNEESESNVFPQIVNEGRKFKVGLIAITQQPKVMDPVILSQFNTLIILGISDENDFEVLKGCSQNSLQQLKLEIKQLMPGEAIVSSPNLPFAMPLKVFLYEDYIKNHQGNTSALLSPTMDSFTGFE